MTKVVIIGGGTGLPALLMGIKKIQNIDITAIVTIADSGGSTGILTKHFHIPAVGDLRRVLAALSRNRIELEESMEYRIEGTGTDLDGHAVGNLILASQILMKNDFDKGIEAASRMLNVEGTVIPVSNEFNHLHAQLRDGSIVKGEDKIGRVRQKIDKVFYKKGKASALASKAIENADYVIFGIGSLYSSLIANLIYPEIQLALKNTKAEIIYFANIFTEFSETHNMTLKDHIDAIEKHTFKNIIDKIIVSNTHIKKDILDLYQKNHQSLVKIDVNGVIKRDLTSFINHDNVAHDEFKIKKVVEELIVK